MRPPPLSIPLIPSPSRPVHLLAPLTPAPSGAVACLKEAANAAAVVLAAAEASVAVVAAEVVGVGYLETHFERGGGVWERGGTGMR